MRKFVYLILVLISATLAICSLFTFFKKRKNKSRNNDI